MAITLTDAGAGRVKPVEAVDLYRYAGEWFEIARFPNRFQHRCASDVRVTYELRADGRITIISRCRSADGSEIVTRGVARVVDPQSRARLEVRFAPAVLSFLPFVWAHYWIIGLDPEYDWALVGGPDRQYLWILSRSPTLDESRFDEVTNQARAKGFDTSRLVRTPHHT